MARNRPGVVIDQASSDSDFLLDEMTDEIEAGCVTGNELDTLVRELVLTLPNETDPRARESIMNLLSEAYPGTGVRNLVDDYVVKNISDMPAAEVVHALAILAESAVPERARLLQDFAQSENTAIRETAVSYLT